MDFTKGLTCPVCGEHVDFLGGQVGGLLTTANVNCSCGFSGVLVVCRDGYEYSIKTRKQNEPEQKDSNYKENTLEELYIMRDSLTNTMKYLKGSSYKELDIVKYEIQKELDYRVRGKKLCGIVG